MTYYGSLYCFQGHVIKNTKNNLEKRGPRTFLDHLCDNVYFFGSHQDKISFLNQKIESGFVLPRHSLKHFFYFIQNCYVIQELLLILWKAYFHYCRKVVISCASNCICCQLHDFFRMVYQPSSSQTGGYSHWILSRIFIIWK